jgi:ABC-type nitrate/sulfonate/bicarbonate transport system substrate-binding protein
MRDRSRRTILRRTRHGLTAAVAAVALGGVVAACSSSGSSSPSTSAGGGSSTATTSTLTVSVASADFSFSPLFLAESQGYFAKEGLKVNILTGPVASTVPYLVSGKADLTLYAVLPGLLAADQGADIKFVYQNLNIFGLALLGAPNVKTVAQAQALQSCKIGSAPAGSLTYAFTNLYIQKLGLKCTISQVTSVPLVASGTVAGTYQLGVDTLSPSVVAASSGANLLVDPRSPGFEAKYIPEAYLDESVFGIGSHLATIKPQVVKFIQAMQQVQGLLKSQTPAQLAADLLESPQFAGQSASSLTTGFTQLKSTLQQGCLGGAQGEITETCWNATLKGVGTWGVPTFNSESSANTYANRVDMSYYDAAQSH